MPANAPVSDGRPAVRGRQPSAGRSRRRWPGRRSCIVAGRPGCAVPPTAKLGAVVVERPSGRRRTRRRSRRTGCSRPACSSTRSVTELPRSVPDAIGERSLGAVERRRSAASSDVRRSTSRARSAGRRRAPTSAGRALARWMAVLGGAENARGRDPSPSAGSEVRSRQRHALNAGSPLAQLVPPSSGTARLTRLVATDSPLGP